MPRGDDPFRQGFVRIINRGDHAGEVRIDAFDDEGNHHGPLTLSLGGGRTIHFNSTDLEVSNPDKGLGGAAGSGTGDWRLELRTELDIEPLAFIRTKDRFLTAMHETAPSQGGRHWVAFLNPASNDRQVSLLRLVNPGEADAEVRITGVDDRGGRSGAVTLSIGAGKSRTLSSQQLEAGGAGLDGALGDGAGKWRLEVESPARPSGDEPAQEPHRAPDEPVHGPRATRGWTRTAR